MKVTGKVCDPQFSKDGHVRIVLEVNERQKALEELDRLRDQDLDISIDKHRNHRSTDANAYFWQLVDKIGKVLRADKWDVYLLQLSRWGVFNDVIIQERAYPTLQTHFRYTEILREDEDEDPETEQLFKWLTVRCFYGSSDYNTKEMSDLIEGTVEDAKDLGIETIPEAEIARMIAAMEDKAWIGKNKG